MIFHNYRQPAELSEGVSACGKVELGEGLKDLLPSESSAGWEEVGDFFPTSRGFAKWRKIEAESFDLDGT